MKKNGCKILFVTPPFTQLNTPYPATAYLKGFFNTLGIQTAQSDLGLQVTLRIFSAEGLRNIFSISEEYLQEASENSQRIYALRHEYISTVDRVISFLQGNNFTLAHSIITRDFLPEASRFGAIEDVEWAFGDLGIQDYAKHLATMYLEDLADFIVECVDPRFGFSRYAEKIALAASYFDELYEATQIPPGIIDQWIREEMVKEISKFNPEIVAISIPFPGNLFGALRCGQLIKEQFPHIPVVWGGGYVNTELRSISDPRVFEFVDFICLDDGEAPLSILLEHLEGKRNLLSLKRTFTLQDGIVKYFNGAPEPDFTHSQVGTPDYSDLLLRQYISVLEIANPMHRLWSDGRWNKLTLAHGCYWGKCTFCDISLDYIKRYEPVTAQILCDRIETIISQTTETGFHFVDEAAPPALMRDLAIEILKRDLRITWWTNIRFEKSFTADLCKLLQMSGCIAVSGGLEVASDRLLKKIKKGVTIEQVVGVTQNFTEAGIMVHAYLMYGFPTQTAQETIDSLEIVRQIFSAGIVQSAYWHLFSMTAHSPVGMNPKDFEVENLLEETGTFANNDLPHYDPTGTDHSQFGSGLKKSLYNYMHGIGFDFELQEWFDFKVPKTTIPKNSIEKFLESNSYKEISPKTRVIWTGTKEFSFVETLKKGRPHLEISLPNKKSAVKLIIDKEQGIWLMNWLKNSHFSNDQTITYSDWEADFTKNNLGYFLLFWNESAITELRKNGLLLV